ncbi:adenosylmethionine decarboxylase [archaeon]|nr:adenosylmethionine decarboxylase [archaeon]|tara:strand:- start:1883 stop:2233 length:351 start_codon:yes stop_codon:yes gene_type:complete
MKIDNGMHLLIDGDGNKKKLNDEVLIERFLENLVVQLKMNKLNNVVIKRVENEGDKDGITGFVLLKESHASIHTFPEKGFFHADVFSCKDFSKERVIEMLKEEFLMKEFNEKVIRR